MVRYLRLCDRGQHVRDDELMLRMMHGQDRARRRSDDAPLPGTVRFLPSATIRDIVTFLLRFNGMPAGNRRLETDYDTLRQIFITRKPMAR
jgi:hypothetical protein